MLKPSSMFLKQSPSSLTVVTRSKNINQLKGKKTYRNLLIFTKHHIIVKWGSTFVFNLSLGDFSNTALLLCAGVVLCADRICHAPVTVSGLFDLWPLVYLPPYPPSFLTLPLPPPPCPRHTDPLPLPRNSGACLRIPWSPWISPDGRAASSTTLWRPRAPPWRRATPGG